MLKPTMWQKINVGSLPIKCQNSTFDIQDGQWIKISTNCKEKAMFRTKISNKEEYGTRDLAEYKYYCAEHTYL